MAGGGKQENQKVIRWKFEWSSFIQNIAAKAAWILEGMVTPSNIVYVLSVSQNIRLYDIKLIVMAILEV